MIEKKRKAIDVLCSLNQVLIHVVLKLQKDKDAQPGEVPGDGEISWGLTH